MEENYSFKLAMRSQQQHREKTHQETVTDPLRSNTSDQEDNHMVEHVMLSYTKSCRSHLDETYLELCNAIFIFWDSRIILSHILAFYMKKPSFCE